MPDDWQDYQKGYNDRYKKNCRPCLFLHEHFVSTSFAGATFHPGDRGSQVLAVQQQLAADGYSLTVDGDYGTGTTEAIRAFQQDHGLTADGILGAATYEALMGVLYEYYGDQFVRRCG